MKGNFTFNKEAFVNDLEYRQMIINAGFNQIKNESCDTKKTFKFMPPNVEENLKSFYTLGMLDGVTMMRQDALDLRSRFAEIREQDINNQKKFVDSLEYIIKSCIDNGVLNITGEMLETLENAINNRKNDVEKDLKQINGLIEELNK